MRLLGNENFSKRSESELAGLGITSEAELEPWRDDSQMIQRLRISLQMLSSLADSLLTEK